MSRYTRRRFLSVSGQSLAVLGLGGFWAQSAVASVGKRPMPAQIEETLDYKIAQMLMLGFRGSVLTNNNPIVADIRDRRIGGVLLFDNGGQGVSNIQSPGQLTVLTSALQALSPVPLLIAADQEGGSVARLKPQYGFPPTVSQQYLGNLNDAQTTSHYASSTASTLAAHGINLNLAPVVDLNTNPNNPVIGSLGRSFSANPLTVAKQALEVIAAHHTYGVRCTLKHFPGHGSSQADSHLGFVDVTNTWAPIELEPYSRLINAGACDIIMTAHIFNARLDPNLPATLSYPTITGILREQLGYDGVVMTDDLIMRAITDRYSFPIAIELAVKAGVDILTISDNLLYRGGTAAYAISIIKQLVQKGAVSAERIDQSYERISRLKLEIRN